MNVVLIGSLVAVAVAAAVGYVLGRARRVRRAPGGAGVEAEERRIREDAKAERARALRDAEIAGREEALALRAAGVTALHAEEEALGRAATAAVEREVALAAAEREHAELASRLTEREAQVSALEEEGRARGQQLAALEAEGRRALERRTGEALAELRARLRDAEVEMARAHGAELVRRVSEGAGGAEQLREAKRLMGIAVARFSAHYLTERATSYVPVPPPRNGRPLVGDAELRAIESVANVKLTLNEAQDSVRLEGLDGVGRELARRCLGRLARQATARGEAVVRIARELSQELDREIMELGRRAFAVLEIPPAHADIVRLVGRLNWRTSYTQNQWKHAIEAGFLCGMMADELGLDLKLARRAALMHDIGKALTHELDGSHAVIGADFARRLGENEVVANAIGAHHTDEPFNSAYAYLVAAADAMSGARPGARRQSDDNHLAKIADLERIPRRFPGVGEAFAVQGGREVRVIVEEDRVDDLQAVKLSTEIAEAISREVTFPGQIRVTVIRELRAEEVAS